MLAGVGAGVGVATAVVAAASVAWLATAGVVFELAQPFFKKRRKKEKSGMAKVREERVSH